MILIDYEIKSSPIHGAGMFTKQAIKKGEVIAIASPELDVDISVETFNKLQQREKDEILYWGFYDAPRGVYHVDFDNTKFINHDKNGNITQDSEHLEMCLAANRDIEKGEELLQNYLEFETPEEFALRGIKD